MPGWEDCDRHLARVGGVRETYHPKESQRAQVGARFAPFTEGTIFLWKCGTLLAEKLCLDNLLLNYNINIFRVLILCVATKGFMPIPVAARPKA